MNRTGCYVRVSTDNQLENYSIEEQIDRLKAFCKAKDYTIVNFYTDGGYSGGTVCRPALQQLIHDIEDHMIDTVIVYKLDRLSRSQKDTLMLIEDSFLANDVDFISVNENFDTSTPFGRAMIGILSVFAQLEKDQITERFTMGRIGRAKSGLYHGGPAAPTGYDYVDGKLIVNEYEALQVQELFERFSKGYSLYSCWQYMKQNYTTKYGAWKSETLIRNVLRNDIYIGKIKFAQKSYVGKHEPIIDNDLFEKVHSIFENRRTGNHTPGKLPFRSSTLLSGLIYCGKCGAKFHGEHGNYSCYSRTKGDKKYVADPDCKNKKWKTDKLDGIVIALICKLDFNDVKKTAISLRKVQDYSKRISEIDTQISRMVELYQVGNISLTIITQKINDLTMEKETLINNSIQKEDHGLSETILPAQKQVVALMSSGTLDERRTCLGILIKKIVINDDDVHIYLNDV